MTVESAASTWSEDAPTRPIPSRRKNVPIRALHTGRSPIHRYAPGASERATAWLRRADFVTIVAVLGFAQLYATLGTSSITARAVLGVTLRFSQLLTLFACASLWSLAYRTFGLYANDADELGRAFRRFALASVVGTCMTMLAHPWSVAPVGGSALVIGQSAVLLWGAVCVLTGLTRVAIWGVEHAPVARTVKQVLIVGSGPRAIDHYRVLMNDRRRRYHVIGFVDTREHQALRTIKAALMGRLHELEEILTRTVVDEVYIALPLRSCYNEFQRTIRVCEHVGVRTVYNVDAFEYQRAAPRYQQANGIPVATLTPVERDTHLPVKRAVDIIVSALALVILAPVLIVIALLVALTSQGPVFFVQERYGQNKRRFRLYKFRSMRMDAEEILRGDLLLWEEYRRNHFKLPEHRDPRLTPIGAFLRKSSLDELPQLWNVLRGDMSLIGPRPIVPAEIEHYGSFASLLLAVKPGLAGAWVVHGRSTVGYPHRAEIELSYIREWSLMRDVKIFLQTIPAVLLGRGAH